MKHSEDSLKNELSAQLSKLEGVTAQYNQLASEAATQNERAQADIEKIVTAMTAEKEKALSDLEDTLSREKSEEVNNLERRLPRSPRARDEHVQV